MRNPFKAGDQKTYEVVVRPDDAAAFASGMVHPFYSTFALARDVEWACRLFVLEMKDADEEGIGTHLSIDHLAPALVGMRVRITATLEEVRGNRVICSYEVHEGDRLLARGRQEQRIVKKAKIARLIEDLKHRHESSAR